MGPQSKGNTSQVEEKNTLYSKLGYLPSAQMLILVTPNFILFQYVCLYVCYYRIPAKMILRNSFIFVRALKIEGIFCIFKPVDQKKSGPQSGIDCSGH